MRVIFKTVTPWMDRREIEYVRGFVKAIHADEQTRAGFDDVESAHPWQAV
jgi:hypothetical protein